MTMKKTNTGKIFLILIYIFFLPFLLVYLYFLKNIDKSNYQLLNYLFINIVIFLIYFFIRYKLKIKKITYIAEIIFLVSISICLFFIFAIGIYGSIVHISNLYEIYFNELKYFNIQDFIRNLTASYQFFYVIFLFSTLIYFRINKYKDGLLIPMFFVISYYNIVIISSSILK